ncbi:MAG: hypothetical protein ABI473_08270 [Candidatus Dormibacter sp.]
MADDEVLAWTAIKPGHKILDREGQELGAVHRVLADEGADIFHGVSLRWGVFGPEVEITADRIERVTAEYIRTDLGAEQVDSLSPARGG